MKIEVTQQPAPYQRKRLVIELETRYDEDRLARILRQSDPGTQFFAESILDALKNATAEESTTPAVAVPEGFTPWSGGTRPVADKTRVEVKYRDGTSSGDLASHFCWEHLGSPLDVIAYKVVEPEEQPWIEWSGGDRCPVPDGAKFQVRLDGDAPSGDVHTAPTLRWGHSGHMGYITHYRIVEPPKGWTKWEAKAGATCPVPDGVPYETMLGNGWIETHTEGTCWDSLIHPLARVIAYRLKDGWVKWDGGECPVDHHQTVEIALRDRSGDRGDSGRFRWWHFEPEHTSAAYDIVAYRLI